MLKQQVQEQMTQALRARDEALLSTLRLFLAAINNEEIDKQRPATDEDVITVAKRQVKQRRESIEAYQKAGRPELVEKETKELEILSKFIPEQMSEEELKKIVSEVISQLPEGERSNFGKVMGAVMVGVKGKADGGMVSRVVKEIASGVNPSQ